MNIFVYIFSAVILCFSTCKVNAIENKDSQLDQYIDSQLGTTPNQIDFHNFLPNQWDRLCILGPYTTNNSAEKTLGFKWDVDSLTQISINDSISLVVFTQNHKVVRYGSVFRPKVDFSAVSHQCSYRDNSVFIHINAGTNKAKWILKK